MPIPIDLFILQIKLDAIVVAYRHWNILNIILYTASDHWTLNVFEDTN